MSDGGAAEIDDFLYQKRRKIYPRQVSGRFARLRIAAVAALLGLYYALPWLNWNGRQAVLFDLPARQFHLFGITFWPQDFIFLTGLLIVAALSLFFFTTLAGRLWCGYACPQTVWTETFLWIERRVEGDRARQIKLDKTPWGPRKIGLKSLKHALWIGYALLTGVTFVGYFSPIRELVVAALDFRLSAWETFWVMFYSLATYGNAGWLREQVCLYMCPYARFQSAMFDSDTLVVAYDSARGEPRGGRRRDAAPKTLGDCIDCTLCVQVCPTGIDIRDGLQYECIGCAACIDACDQVMEKMRYPRGLIRYTTANALADSGGAGRAARLLRPRVVVYGLLLLTLLAALGTAIARRTPLQLDVIRDRHALYRQGENGLISNVYTLKILNKDQREHDYRLGVDGVPGLRLTAPAGLRAAPGDVLSVVVELHADLLALRSASSEVRFTLRATPEAAADDALQVSETARFIGPFGSD